MKWTDEKIGEMESWKIKNQATIKETADHFELPFGAYHSARSNRINNISKYKLKKSSAKKEIADLELEIPKASQEKPVAMILLTPAQLKSVMDGLWQ